MTVDATRPGRIITFYSYKGGTGRSMAVANIAWILASNGKRVLVVDWDLEAPGLHRYFHPFLPDKELTSSPGLIDFFVDFAVAARQPDAAEQGRDAKPWWTPWAQWTRYAYSLEWEFPGAGTIDFVPAGQQSAAYGVRVTSFDWQAFYERLGGGLLLEAVKAWMRQEYDYVLIDSRTGISDTSGICTLQMPDDLLLCFTMNRQNVLGAAAVASTVWKGRRKESGEPAIRIWPLPTRIEVAEKERLDTARDFVRSTFHGYLGHLTRENRDRYWGECEVLYHPFYAYEEVLAAFADRPRRGASMLTAMEVVTRWLTAGDVDRLGEMSEEQRRRGLGGFAVNLSGRNGASGASVGALVLWSREDGRIGRELVRSLESQGVSVASNAQFPTLLGAPPGDWLGALVRTASILVVIVGESGIDQDQEAAVDAAIKEERAVVPVLMRRAVIPRTLSRWQAITLAEDWSAAGLATVAVEIAAAVRGVREAVHPDDPQKGRWGGCAAANGLALRARVIEISPDWFEITLEVAVPDGVLRRLTGTVEFHLHPTFSRTTEVVDVTYDKATLKVQAYGAFTVGAVADEGRTVLELDLAQDERFPATFRER